MAKKRDEGHEETEKVLADIEKEISKEYAQAEKEISEKLDDYLRRFEVKDKIKYNAWQEGKITEAEYKQWRLGQVAVGERWQEMKDSLAQDFTNAAEIGKSITDGHMPEVYAINHNYGTYQVEQTAHVDTSYTLYDRQSVEHLFKGEGKLYHDYGIKTGIAIAEGKQQAWDRKQIQSVMTQALLQGESIGKIATRLSKTVGDSDRKACIRNARTMTTGVQNAGRVDSYKRAESMGIELEQEWLATLDSRTRHEHRMLDGQRVKVGEKFKVDGYELAFPADPEGEAFLVYNCRCTLVPALKGFNVDSSDTSLRHTDYMNEQTYDEWKESHYIISDSITKQDDIAEMMRESYRQEYAYLAGNNPNIPASRNADVTVGHEETTHSASENEQEKRWQGLPEPTAFTPASSISEAESYANNFVDGGFSLTGKNMSYKGISVDVANEINKTLTSLYEAFNIPNLSSIETFGKANKKVFSQNGDAPFATTNFGNLVINTIFNKDMNAINAYIKDGQSAFNYVIQNIDKLKGAQLELAMSYQSAGRSLVGDSLADMIIHEIGHHISYMPEVNTELSAISRDGAWKDFAKKLSGYSNHSFGEYVAESFDAYCKGETDKVQPEMMEVFEKLRKKDG